MTPNLQDATNALQQGNKGLAIGTLATVVRSEPNNEKAWLMLASLLDDNDQKRHCLERVMAINPGNSRAALEGMRLQQAPVTSRPVPPAVPKRHSVESVQCPKCGAAVDVTLDRQSMNCTYCGAGLRIVQGSSGHPIATLDDIKMDTSILASATALKRLDERLCEKQETSHQLAAQLEMAWAALGQRMLNDRTRVQGRATWGTILILVGVTLLAPAVLCSGSMSLWPPLVGVWILLLGVVLVATKRSAARLPDESLAERIRSIELQLRGVAEEMEGIKSQKNALKYQIDTLTRQL